jgi:CBS domain-containing protein
MLPEDIRNEETEETDAPLEGDEGEPELHRSADVGKAILAAKVSDVEHSPAVALPQDATVAKAIETMRKKKVGAVMVVSKKRPKKLVGIFTERDLLQRVLDKKGYGRLKLQKVMTANPEHLRARDGLAYALNKMSVGRFRHIPVVDDDLVPKGMLSIRDIIDFVVEVIPEAVLNLPPEPDLAIAKTVDGG